MEPAFRAGSCLPARAHQDNVKGPTWQRVGALSAALFEEEDGQDLVEYVLLGAFVAIVTLIGLRLIENVMEAEYIRLDEDEQDLWIPPNP